MKIELNTNLVPIFGGTYGSNWEVYEIDDDNQELEVEFEPQDFMTSILEAYQSKAKDIEDMFKGAGMDFLTNLKFTSTWSPREYNFKNDELNFSVSLNKAKLLAKLRELETDEFKQFLADNYTSRDGFISWTPNNYPELMDSIKNENDDFYPSIGAVCHYLLQDNTIEDDVLEYWNSNGYMGLDYKIVSDGEEVNNE
jgi:hypothetical protein